jgi:carbamoyl-phosphate synthase large subunit
MENFDPLGIHTGESIVVAPSQTLSNNEYQRLRDISIKIVKHLGIIGECNVQFALDPHSEEYRVIEVNARLSRSSALASKATGYPLAFIAAKLALGYSLFDLKNSVTKTTTAFFEPALDYITCKIPRWDLGKFKGVSKHIGSSMKSVGEVMAIGRTFEEAIQKGLRMIGQGMHGFTGNKDLEFDDSSKIETELGTPTDMRIFVIAMAFEKGFSIDKINQITGIDRWFLYKLKNIFDISSKLKQFNIIEDVPTELLIDSKKAGFSDFQISKLLRENIDDDATDYSLQVREFRIKNNIVPFIKQIDTLAGEYPAKTNYLYLTYSGIENDIEFENSKKRVIVLGSGAYCIGSSVEFDWCSVNALNTIRKNGYDAVMINYNPETVSTDYDVCDRLYFDELTYERVLDIIELEKPLGVIVSTGGQIPNNLAIRLHKANVNILGTSPLSIDSAEDRHKFSGMLDTYSIDQPRWRELTNIDDIIKFVNSVGFPVLVRPSYVLSGAAMNVVSNIKELQHFLTLATNVSKRYPVVISEFIEDAKEIEFDAVAKDGEIITYAISEHVEFAGVHSGDATIVFPAQKIYIETIRRIKKIARQISGQLKISGPFNIQFLAKDNDIKVIECNLRASRSFPFVSKVLKTNFIELATNIMLGINVVKPEKSIFDLDYVGVKAPQFSFSRLQKADPILGVEMASTGEAGCIGEDYYDAILKAMLSVGYKIPKNNILLSTGPSRSMIELLNSAQLLSEKGYNLFATEDTYGFLKANGIHSTMLYSSQDKGNPNVIDYLSERILELVINIPKSLTDSDLQYDYLIRRTAVDYNIPLITNSRLAAAFIYAFCKKDISELSLKSWREY